jgi:hypothetical protein
MKLPQTFISIVFCLSGIGVTQLASAEPVSTSMTQRDGAVSSQACMEQARTALQRMNFLNIEVSEASTKGDYQDYLAIVGCYEVKSTKGVLVQSIIVSGPSKTEARRLREELIKAMD